MVNVERVSAILTLRAWFWEKSTSLKYCRITWLGWRSHASVVSAHSFANYADKDSRFCTSLHALPVATRLYLCEGFPNVQLNSPMQLLPTLRLCGVPLWRFSLSTIATIRQWHLFLPHVLHADRKTDTQKRAKLDLRYLFDEKKHLTNEDFSIWAWYYCT